MVKSHVLLKEVLKDRIATESQLPKDKRKSARAKLERKKAIRQSVTQQPKRKKRGQFHSLGLLADALSDINTAAEELPSVPRLGKNEKTHLRNADAQRLQQIAQSQAYIANPLQAMSQHLAYAYAQRSGKS